MKISIVGLGWLGLPLADHLMNLGHQVIGSTTTIEKSIFLTKKGYNNAVLKFNPHPEGSEFQRLFQADLIVINIPPRTRTADPTFHPEQIKYLKELINQSGISKVIYVSATSVYPDENQVAREADLLSKKNTGNIALFDAENLLWKDKQYDLTVVRFGGLLGVDRIPGRYFSGKENVEGDSPVNYIHRDDAVNLLSWIIEKNLWNETFNGVTPLHPQRKEVYEKNAKELGFDPPKSYDKSETKLWKKISCNKILETGFEFKISDPLDFWDQV
ncbi:6-phosphogluconate dehydrogenase-like protein [Belliella baltica DSM 15883]|uniref:6-phosphogluconate dehydrogenase-like protein n=1 Tax=Belliella baltica (strain DSM 15883 / CIP 108006 / LMG 21964 / BA134) TaxID=866536 RepID=I3Z4Q7_BELBD|nr:epimerase [Belliella baltica]AFL84225.1 6-phosphogluconate dehydrogenase-like protein [Belliella baltica DSM 15883]